MLLAAQKNTRFERQRSKKEIGGKESENCIKQEEGMRFNNTIKMKKIYEI